MSLFKKTLSQGVFVGLGLTLVVFLTTPSVFAQKKARAPVLALEEDDDFPRFTIDLGVSIGSYDDRNYTEASLGLNTYFKDWLIWRNAAFGRFVSEADDIYGLDSSLRAVGRVGRNSNVGLTAFAGPGYRMVNKGDGAPFAEAGAILRLGGFSLGGGAKVLFYGEREGLPNQDTIYFIILAGGATL